MKNQKVKICAKRAAMASHHLAGLSSDEKSRALFRFADLIWEQRGPILKSNAKDMKREEETLSPALLARLKLDESKLNILCEGIREIARAPDPVNMILNRLELDRDLILEKRTVPIGVIAVIFESRPDVIPQILSLFLKSGNAGLLKGGREARESNRQFMKIAGMLSKEFEFLPKNWAQLFLERRDVDEILKCDTEVNLVIPRGSNALVKSIMRRTKIPVLGHADGVCHIFWDADADFAMVENVVVDAKTQYPAVCNSLETLLVHKSNSQKLIELLDVLTNLGVKIFGDASVCRIYKAASRVKNWHTEYGDLRLSVRLVESVRQAIDHINEFGSHHTDGILTQNAVSEREFLAKVDSATLTVNASTRFADGYRFGMGAEVGISTNKTHARGPVGVEGLIIHQYVLKGRGHVVKDYVGLHAKKFKHRKLMGD